MLPRIGMVQSGYENVSIYGKQQALRSGVPLAMCKSAKFLLLPVFVLSTKLVEMTLFPQGWREDSFPMINKFNKNYSLLKSLY